jgi:thiamine biosynthesis lipoprotein
MPFNSLKLLLLIFFSTLLVSACSDVQEPNVYQLNGNTMGTSYSITVVGDVRIDPTLVTNALENIENSMSTYRPDSELMQLNKAPVDTWITISEELYEVLTISETVSQLSDGAFDISIGPLVDLWGFGPDKSNFGSPPDNPEQVENILRNIGYQHLVLASDETAALKTKMISLDLSAVAKGYAVDVIAELLEANTINNYLVEVGGEISAQGSNAQGEPWRIAIESPLKSNNQEAFRVIQINNLSVASSGDYRNFYEEDGISYSHTLDPRTGYPVNHQLASVTVLTDSAAFADALATAFNVMGTEQALLLANQHQIPAFFIENTDNGLIEYYSSAFVDYLQ